MNFSKIREKMEKDKNTLASTEEIEKVISVYERYISTGELNDIKGVSEKQIKYAFDLRKAYLEKRIDKFKELYERAKNGSLSKYDTDLILYAVLIRENNARVIIDYCLHVSSFA